MKIPVIFYSLYGNTALLARAVAEGVAAGGGEPLLRRVPETIPLATLRELEKNPQYQQAQAEMQDIPLAGLEDLNDVSAVIWGSPCHFGNMSAQLKQFFDATVPLWAQGVLAGKPAGVFTSSGSLHGGSETTLFSMLLPLLHHGMIIVGATYAEPAVGEVGSPYGPMAVTGINADQKPGEANLRVARHLGERVARVAAKLTDR